MSDRLEQLCIELSDRGKIKLESVKSGEFFAFIEIFDKVITNNWHIISDYQPTPLAALEVLTTKVEKELYTGVKDITGKMILKGDIVRLLSKLPGKESIMAYKVVYQDTANAKGIILPDHLDYEVVGQYFKNPELVKAYGLDKQLIQENL